MTTRRDALKATVAATLGIELKEATAVELRDDDVMMVLKVDRIRSEDRIRQVFNVFRTALDRAGHEKMPILIVDDTVNIEMIRKPSGA